MPSSGTTGKLLVQLADEMDDDIFIMHMNARHSESLGGLDAIWFISEYVTECWRAFHWRLHSLRVDLNHEHEE